MRGVQFIVKKPVYAKRSHTLTLLVSATLDEHERRDVALENIPGAVYRMS